MAKTTVERAPLRKRHSRRGRRAGRAATREAPWDILSSGFSALVVSAWLSFGIAMVLRERYPAQGCTCSATLLKKFDFLREVTRWRWTIWLEERDSVKADHKRDGGVDHRHETRLNKECLCGGWVILCVNRITSTGKLNEGNDACTETISQAKRKRSN